MLLNVRNETSGMADSNITSRAKLKLAASLSSNITN